jgi:hypothetical protein
MEIGILSKMGAASTLIPTLRMGMCSKLRLSQSTIVLSLRKDLDSFVAMRQYLNRTGTTPIDVLHYSIDDNRTEFATGFASLSLGATIGK